MQYLESHGNCLMHYQMHYTPMIGWNSGTADIAREPSIPGGYSP